MWFDLFLCIFIQDASIIEKRDLSRKIIDKFLESIVEIINRLDLSLKDNVESELVSLFSSSISKVYCVNLVDA